MILCKVFLVLATMLSLAASSTESINISHEKSVKGQDDGKVRDKRFLFNLFPSVFNGGYNLFNEDDQVRWFQQQRRVLNRVNPGFNQGPGGLDFNNPFSISNDNFYLQSHLQQRRVRQRYFEETGERLYSDRGYYDNDNYRYRN